MGKYHRECVPGSLHMLSGTSDPAAFSPVALYLLQGNVVDAPIEHIIPERDVDFPAAGQVEDGFRLLVGHFNDFHGRLSELKAGGSDVTVFSRMVTRLKQLREGIEGDDRAAMLLLSAGDDLNGYLFSELLGRTPDTLNLHAAYRAYQAAGLHACAVGNHELDLGMQMLTETVAREACFPVLSANLVLAPHLRQSIYPAAILVANGLRIGIVGLTTRAECHSFGVSDFEIADPLPVCRNILPALRPLCDVVILLSHLGLSLQSKTAIVEKYGDVELAQQLDPAWVDLIVGGHTHNTLNCDGMAPENIVNQIPIVQAGAYGRWLGEVTLQKRGRFELRDAHLTSLMEVPADEEFERDVVAPVLQQLQPVREKVLGETIVDPDLTTENVLYNFARRESALANMLADALVYRCRLHGYDVDLAMVDHTSLSGGLEGGAVLTFEDFYGLMPHMDNIQIYRITGEQLALLVQDNVHRLDGWGEAVQERGFAHFSSDLRYQVVPGRNRFEAQAIHISFDNVILSEQKESLFSVATNCFFRGICRDWEQNVAQHNILDIKKMDWPGNCTRLFLRDEIVHHLLEHGGVTADAGLKRDGRLHIMNAS